MSGKAEPVEHPELDPVDYARASAIEVVERIEEAPLDPPPWVGVPPGLETYQERAYRRLAARTYGTKCRACYWGCKMAVEMIIDQWNPQHRRYRTETLCYGPKSCRLYRPGPPRTVPGRRGMTWTEADWVDEENTAHRGDDE